MQWTSIAPAVLASFMASLVEFVEALTIVLAVGVVRGWRSALLGSAASLATLITVVIALGPSLSQIPLHRVQLVIGTLLLLFGLRWLRKAVLRASSVVALHDEGAAFAEETEALRQHGGIGGRAIDKIAFSTSFKIVLLEGMEVVFIVIAIGSGGNLLLPAAAGALLALFVVVLLGLWLHKPLSRVPENTLKFGVGVLLSSFGTFWVGEGVGIAWPGADGALLSLFAVFLLVALALVPVCRRSKAGAQRIARRSKVPAATRQAGVLSKIWNEIAGMFVDDGLLAVGVLVWVATVWTVGLDGAMRNAQVAAAAIFVLGLIALLMASAIRRARQ